MMTMVCNICDALGFFTHLINGQRTAAPLPVLRVAHDVCFMCRRSDRTMGRWCMAVSCRHKYSQRHEFNIVQMGAYDTTAMGNKKNKKKSVIHVASAERPFHAAKPRNALDWLTFRIVCHFAWCFTHCVSSVDPFIVGRADNWLGMHCTRDYAAFAIVRPKWLRRRRPHWQRHITHSLNTSFSSTFTFRCCQMSMSSGRESCTHLRSTDVSRPSFCHVINHFGNCASLRLWRIETSTIEIWSTRYLFHGHLSGITLDVTAHRCWSGASIRGARLRNTCTKRITKKLIRSAEGKITGIETCAPNTVNNSP